MANPYRKRQTSKPAQITGNGREPTQKSHVCGCWRKCLARGPWCRQEAMPSQRSEQAGSLGRVRTKHSRDPIQGLIWGLCNNSVKKLSVMFRPALYSLLKEPARTVKICDTMAFWALVRGLRPLVGSRRRRRRGKRARRPR